MSKLNTFLWFDNHAEEAARFYTTLFKDSELGGIQRYGKDNHGNEGAVMTVSFTLFEQEFTALNGGPVYEHTPATSFMVRCDNQEEIDRYWDALSQGGSQMQCGWVTDKFGITWQIVPAILFSLLSDADPQKGYRVTQAMLKMVKFDINALKKAYDSEN